MTASATPWRQNSRSTGLVGPAGKVYGVDFTKEQLDKARRVATGAV